MGIACHAGNPGLIPLGVACHNFFFLRCLILSARQGYFKNTCPAAGYVATVFRNKLVFSSDNPNNSWEGDYFLQAKFYCQKAIL